MRKITSLFLAFLLVFSLVSCSVTVHVKTSPSETVEETLTEEISGSVTLEGAETSEQGDYAPLLYRVTNDEGGELYLLGSIHVGREDYYPLPDYIYDALKKCDDLTVEADIISFESDLSAQIAAIRLFLAPDGKSITDYVSEDTYQKAVEILKEYNMYASAMDLYTPVLWFNFIEQCTYLAAGAKTELGIDRHLMQYAKENSIPINEVESVEMQYEMLASFSDDLQVTLLESSIASYNLTKNGFNNTEALMDVWAFGTEEEFAEMLKAEENFPNEETRLLYEEYYDAMYTDRNADMAEFAIKCVEERAFTTFLCVGAAHVVGDEALVQILREYGFRVELVR